ncbi:MAG: NRDE family protein [Pseudomonadota bacterium]
MCTLTWFLKDDGYELFFNRDERVTRQRALLPSLASQNDVRYIAPTDADEGGTWIAVNHFGVTVCLLNHYQFEQIKTYKAWISRGELVRQFADTVDIGVAEQQFSHLELSDYRAFRMFIIDATGANRLLVWDGHSPRIERNVNKPKSSSAVDAKYVKQSRRKLFESTVGGQAATVERYIDFHRSHLPSKSQESVCMHRADALTVSLSHISVNAAAAAFSYTDGSPCETNFGETLILPRNGEFGEFESQAGNKEQVSSRG